MKTNKNGFSSKVGRWLQRASPTILSIAAAAGVVVTTVLAVRSTPKALLKINESKNKAHHEDDKQTFPKVEAARACWKCYIPCLITGSMTILCIFAANVLSKRRQASLIAAYEVLEKGFKRYKIAAKEVFGEDSDNKINAQVAKDTYITSRGLIYSDLYDPSKCKEDLRLFYNTITNSYFQATMSSVLNAEYHINRNLNLRGIATVLEFCDFLGIDISDTEFCQDDIGWEYDDGCFCDGLWLDFINDFTTLDDGLECCIIKPCVEPFLIVN